ncbi:MAG: S8 family serine peptidase [Bacteroidota bacterium]
MKTIAYLSRKLKNRGVIYLLLICSYFAFLNFDVSAQSTDTLYYQEDVFAFRCVGGAAYTGSYDSTVVDSMRHRDSRRDKIIEVYFNSSSDSFARVAEIIDIRNSDEYEREFPVVTQYPSEPYSSIKWYIVENLVLINFIEGDPGDTEIARLKDEYNLSDFHTPADDLPEGGIYTYIFEIDDDLETVMTVLEDIDEIIENEDSIILSATPNFLRPDLYYISPYSDLGNEEDVDPTAATGSCPVNDPLFGDSWHVENTGTYSNATNNVTSTNDADADICECWDEGFTGDGVKVGILAQSHLFFGLMAFQDFNSSNVTPLSRNCIASPCSTQTNPFIGAGLPTLDSYRAASLIAANRNNNVLIPGIAEDVELINIVIDYNDLQSVVRGLQEALRQNVDILLTPFFTDMNVPSIATEVRNLVQRGRVLNEFPRGVVIIATTGANENANGNNGTNFYPAAYPETISVIASNPEDELKTIGDGWIFSSTTDFAANYGSQYDVAAPGAEVVAVQPRNVAPSNSANIAIRLPDPKPTSVGVVGGIAAMMLEKTPTLIWNQVKDGIRNGAEKVTYTYTNGISNEFGFGRVNCANSLANIVAIDPGLNLVKRITVNNPVIDYLRTSYEFREPVENGQVALVDLMGRELVSQPLYNPMSGELEIYSGNLSPGVYMLLYLEHSNKVLYSQKILKY